MQWSYGVTTCAERIGTYLPTTLSSLTAAGFGHPRLFVDAADQVESKHAHWLAAYHCTFHEPRIKTAANWVLAALELYTRQPKAERYAIFQDDFVTCLGLREYLETNYPEGGYCNLYTFPQNHPDQLLLRNGWKRQFLSRFPVKKGQQGWYPSNQLGKGAVALVFDNQAMRALLGTKYIIERFQGGETAKGRIVNPNAGIDGGIVSAMKTVGVPEFVHMPSLCQHIGDESSMGNAKHGKAPSFKGERFDVRTISPPPSAPAVHSEVATNLRVGLSGFHCRTGLGELNRQIQKYADIDRMLIKPHRTKSMLPIEDLDVDVTVCKTGVKVRDFVRSVDVIVFCENPLYGNLIKIAKEAGKRVVCVPMQEWMPPKCGKWARNVDLFVCPNEHSYRQFQHLVPCVLFNWPVDLDRYEFRRQEKCRNFLFLDGNGGWHERKGANVIQQAIDLWPELGYRLRIHTQRNHKWIGCNNVSGEVNSNQELYHFENTVLLSPHSCDGLCLETMEAQASGMPVMVTQGQPWNESPAISRIQATKRKQKSGSGRPVDWYEPMPEALVDQCKFWLDSDIGMESDKARQWAKTMDWKEHAEVFDNLVKHVTVEVGR